MKKITSMLLCLALLVSLAACGSNNTPSGTTTPPETTSQPTTEPATEATTEPTAEPTTTPTTEPTEPPTDPTEFQKPENGVYGNNIILGNIKFAIPDGYTATVIDEQTFYLKSADNVCAIALFAPDISALDEPKTRLYLPQQAASFANDDGVRLEESEIAALAAGMYVTLDFYGTLSADLETTINGDLTFTDSWYAYTIIFRCVAESDLISNYSSAFANFLMTSEYIGPDRRFDFVQ